MLLLLFGALNPEIALVFKCGAKEFCEFSGGASSFILAILFYYNINCSSEGVITPNYHFHFSLSIISFANLRI